MLLHKKNYFYHHSNKTFCSTIKNSTHLLHLPPKAFTFAEVLISLFILTGSIYILSGIHFRSGRKTIQSSEEIDRVFYIKKELYTIFLQHGDIIVSGKHLKDKPLKIVMEKPDLTIEAQTQAINKKKSALKSLAQNISIIWTKGTWKRGPNTNVIKMISFVPKQMSTK